MTSADDGRAGRDEGMRRALEHADDVRVDWSERAFAYVRHFAGSGEPFITPEVRSFAYARGLPAPPTHMAWGAVIARAVRSGLIVEIGVIRYGDKTMHRQNVSQWQGAVLTRRAAA